MWSQGGGRPARARLLGAHEELAAPVVARLTVDGQLPHVAAPDVERERPEVHGNGNVDVRARRGARRAADLELPLDAQRLTLDLDREPVLGEELEHPVVGPVGLVPRDVDLHRDRAGRDLGTGHRPAAAEDEELAAALLGGVGEHERHAHAGHQSTFAGLGPFRSPTPAQYFAQMAAIRFFDPNATGYLRAVDVYPDALKARLTEAEVADTSVRLHHGLPGRLQLFEIRLEPGLEIGTHAHADDEIVEARR